MGKRLKLGEMLVAKGLVSAAQLDAALAEQRRWGKRLGMTLVLMGFLEEETLIRTLASLMSGANGAIPEPHEVVARMNEELCQDNPHCMFATVVLATLDLGRRELSFCNAGHPPPYVVGPAGLTMLQAPRAKPLGIRRSFTYATTTRQLEVGDCLFLFTDGVTEALDANGELFSESRLEALEVEVVDARGAAVSGAALRVRDRMHEAWSAFQRLPTTGVYADQPLPEPPSVRLAGGPVELPVVPGRLELVVERDDGTRFHYDCRTVLGARLRLRVPD